MELGTAVKLIRTSSGLKQKDVATKLGVTSNYISLIESGNREPSISLLKNLANIFGVPVGLFFLWDNGTSQKNIGQLRDMLAQIEALYVLANRRKFTRKRKSA